MTFETAACPCVGDGWVHIRLPIKAMGNPVQALGLQVTSVSIEDVEIENGSPRCVEEGPHDDK